MDNLHKLYLHLIEAQDYVYRKMPSSAKMSLMGAEGLLREVHKEYYDVNRMYEEVIILKNNVHRLVKFSDRREVLVEKIEELIGECAAWMECRRRAA